MLPAFTTRTPSRLRSNCRCVCPQTVAERLGEERQRLSWHALRHSFASMLATDLELPVTTLAELVGHADAGFTLKVYARDGRDERAMVADVLSRAIGAGVGA
jgi:integrase